ncbi:MAG: universal stress protein [Bacteroidales bacterium]|jgi:nucleotide-binding universal stress UspA family protein|nr:universal stress protein [Bacteroidales bacterium]
MVNENKTILVLWDFTQNSKNAVQHAIQLAQAANSPIILMHIIQNNSLFGGKGKHTGLKAECEGKLNIEASQLKKHHGVDIEWEVNVGKIHKIVRNTIADKKISLVISPWTYVSKGKALAINKFLKRGLKNIQIPYISTDKAPAHSKYLEIVVPLDYDKKFKETIHWLVYLAKLYKCNINLIKPFYTDQGKKKQMANNIFFTKKVFDSNDIVYGIKTAKKKNPFVQEVYDFTQKIDADLIMIVADKTENYTSNTRLHGESKAPLMCLSPKKRVYQSFT